MARLRPVKSTPLQRDMVTFPFDLSGLRVWLGLAALVLSEVACPGALARPSVDQWQCLWGNGWPSSLGDPQGADRRYTHLGTDWGWMGPAADSLRMVDGMISVHVPAGRWAGIWHSLAGMQRETNLSMDAQALWPADIASDWQSQWVALRMVARGRAKVKLEIKSATSALLWEQWLEVDPSSPPQRICSLPVAALRAAKTLSWVVEGPGQLEVQSVDLGLRHAAQGVAPQVLVMSLAKLLRCAPAQGGWFKDRAHWPQGAMASVSATGLGVLAAVACAQQPLCILPLRHAKRCFDEVLLQARHVDRALGLLPHFVQGVGQAQRIHPGTEFSTVDSALFFQAMLLAAEMLGDKPGKDQLEVMVRQVQASHLLLKEGWYGHGVKEDGQSLLPYSWADWGGETVLVNGLMAMAGGPKPARARNPGQVWQGTGFIGELQSLLHPDFDQSMPDALDGVNWLAARRSLLAQQRAAMPARWPQSQLAQAGVFGLSAGEALSGDAYRVNGSERPGAEELHPHYLLMAWALAGPGSLLEPLKTMQQRGWFAGWGMVEAVSPDGLRVQPMQGALNAAFEVLGAYHAVCRLRGIEDRIYSASLRQALIRSALRWYFPGAVQGP